MKLPCPHCSQNLELDPETIIALEGESQFDCPTCGCAVKVPAPVLVPAKRMVPGRAGKPTPERVVGGTQQGMNRNLLVLGVVALLAIGGVAVFLASKNGGNIFNTFQNTTNQIINNSYFTQLIADGVTTRDDLKLIDEIRPYGTGFIGITKKAVNWSEASALARRTGSEPLTFADTGGDSDQLLIKWLRASFDALIESSTWVRQDGEPRALDSSDIPIPMDLQSSRKLALQWRPVVSTGTSSPESIDFAESNTPEWEAFTSNQPAEVSENIERVREGTSSLLFTTMDGLDTGVRFPANAKWNFDATPFDAFTFWEYAENNNQSGWQGNQPIVVIHTSGGSIRLEPETQQTPNFTWKRISVPLSGGNGWLRTTSGEPDLGKVTQIEIHHDTWDYGFRIWIDGVRFNTVGEAGRPSADAVPSLGPEETGHLVALASDPKVAVTASVAAVETSLLPSASAGNELVTQVAGAAVAPGAVLNVRVLVLNYAPQFENRALHEIFNWNDPRKLALGYEEDMEQSSGGRVQFEIVEWRDIDAIYSPVGGEAPAIADYVKGRREKTLREGAQADYPRLIAEQKVVPMVNEGRIDEVWIFGDHFFGLWEASMAGPGAFFINGGVYPEVQSTRPFAFYGFNYERGVAEMLHNTAHRTEATLNRIYGQWDLKNPKNNWEKFSANHSQSNGVAGVGTCHWPANAVSDYDYGNLRNVESWADDFLNYPNLTGVTKRVSVATWSEKGGDHHRNYMKWYFSHLPRADGINPDGKWNNWWRYIYDLSGATERAEITPPSAATAL